MVDFRYILRIEPIGDPEQLSVGYEKKKGPRFWTLATTKKESLITHMERKIFAKY